MPYRNRVTPEGDLVAVADRGTVTGNRGVLHDEQAEIVRRAQGRRWIICGLRFRGRHRVVMSPNRYTHLFFLDEATALAAGHRPCGECRHDDYQRYRRLWALAAGSADLPTADAMDHVLHRERRLVDGRRPTVPLDAGTLPDGVFLALHDGPWLVRGGDVLRWTPGGYTERRPLPPGRLPALTPPATVAVIRAGYRPELHPTAART